MTEIPAVRATTAVASSPEDVTRITVHPQSAEEGFFGKDGLTFGDLVDAVNPLNHIPFVSDLIGGEGDAKPSVAAKLIGGALMGGPIGFIASLANCIFEQATGQGVVGSAVAALSGETPEGATQLAANDHPFAPENAEEMQTAMAAPTEPVDIAQMQPVDQSSTHSAGTAPAKAALEVASADRYADIARRAQVGMLPDVSGATDSERNKEILSLFGSSAPSASRAYQNAQMLPYLKQANSQVL